MTGIAVVGGGGYFFSTCVYVKWVAISDDRRVKAKFNTPITMTAVSDDYVNRLDVETSIKKILTADKVYNYWVISGEHGTGKTTTVQKVCKEVGKGIIYVDVPKNVANFKDALANAIGWTHRHHSGLSSFIHQLVYGRESLPGNFNY
jgi:hypothetical protein